MGEELSLPQLHQMRWDRSMPPLEPHTQLLTVAQRLLGLDHLLLWEGCPMTALVGDLQTAKNRVAYFLANPSRADLVDKIEEYPGLNTFHTLSLSQLDDVSTKEVPWVQQPSIPHLSSSSLSAATERALVEELTETASIRHTLTFTPNAWMKAFGVRDEEVEGVNAEILADLRRREAEYRRERIEQGRGILGAERLVRQEILKAHTPKKKSRRIFFLASTAELRQQLLYEYRCFVAECRRCYEKAKAGIIVHWPEGAFRPQMPPLSNAVAL